MTLTQRIPKAVLVTVLGLLLLGGTTGLAAAAGEPDLPRTFSVPMPQVGDRWQYEMWVAAEGAGEVEMETDAVVYGWREAEAMQDVHGRWRVVHALVEQNVSDADAWASYLLDAATGETIGSRRDTSSGSHGFSQHLAGLSQQTSTRREATWATSFTPVPTVCGLRSALQGADVPLDRPVAFQGLCGLDAGSTEALGVPFGPAGMLRAQGVDAVDGIAAVVFSGNDRLPFGPGVFELDVRLWMSPAIPYPVRADYRFAFDLEFEGEHVHLAVRVGMRMTGFERGDGGWGGVSLPSGPVPPIALAPRQAWGPDDSGIDMPFRARDAWAMAQADPEAAAWFADHDDAAAVEGTFGQMEFEDRIERTWRLLAAEGRDAAWIEATAVEWKGEAWALLAQAGLDGPAGAAAERATGRGGVALSTVRLERPIELALDLPTIRSVQARWASMGVADAPANGYAFSACSGGCDGFVEAGRFDGSDDTPAVQDPTSPSTRTVREQRSVLVVGTAGNIVAVEESVREDTRRESGILATSAPPEEVAAGPAGEVHALAAPWTFPSAPAAASVAAGAFLVGLVYWLWPVLKSGGTVGLFSRVRRDEMLEHPVRRTIHEAVQANPGIHYQQLIRTVGKGRGTVEHHLRKLQEGGYVVAHRNAGHTCFFVRGALDHSVMAAVPAIRTEAAARVLALIQQRPGIRSTDVAAQLNLARSTASHHVRRLREAGLVEQAGGTLVPSRLAQPALAAVAS